MMPWRRLFYVAVVQWHIDPERFWDMTPVQLVILDEEDREAHQRAERRAAEGSA
jgi:hypothetical protein